MDIVVEQKKGTITVPSITIQIRIMTTREKGEC